MQILLLRHCDKETSGDKDCERALCDRGRLQASVLEQKLRRRTPGEDQSRPVDVVDSLLEETGRLDVAVIAIVGHEPRLSQLLTRMAGCHLHPLLDGEALRAEATRMSDLLEDRATVAFRTAGGRLGSKLSSK